MLDCNFIFLFFCFFFIFFFSEQQTAIIAEADENLTELAFQYGRNIGLAFQLVDDMLDFVSSTETMGKPTAADLKLGLATAPVLFACEKVSFSFFFSFYLISITNLFLFS